MDAASKILVVGGVLNLAFGLLTGLVLGGLRSRNPDADHKYLLSAHKAGLQQGFMLLGLTFAVMLSPLSASFETIAAALLAASSFFLDVSALANWRQGVCDEFKERSPGLQLGGLSGLLAVAGLAILIFGVFRGL